MRIDFGGDQKPIEKICKEVRRCCCYCWRCWLLLLLLMLLLLMLLLSLLLLLLFSLLMLTLLTLLLLLLLLLLRRLASHLGSLCGCCFSHQHLLCCGHCDKKPELGAAVVVAAI